MPEAVGGCATGSAAKENAGLTTALAAPAPNSRANVLREIVTVLISKPPRLIRSIIAVALRRAKLFAVSNSRACILAVDSRRIFDTVSAE